MKVDHLAADEDRTGVCVSGHWQSKAAIKGEHLIGVFHRKGHVIEASDSCRVLRRTAGAISQYSSGSNDLNERSPRNAIFHHAPRHNFLDFAAGL
jgi:hypothetical protein